MIRKIYNKKIRLSIEIRNLLHNANVKIYLVTLLILGSNQLFCQDFILNYDDAIKMALKQNIYLKQESNLLILTKAQTQQSIAGFAPSINAYGEGARTDGRQYSNEESTMVNTGINRLNYGIGSNLTIFNGGQNYYRLKQSNQILVAQEKKIERETQNIIFQTSLQYLQILLDKELLIIVQNNYELDKSLYEQVKAFVNVGTRTQEDLLTQEAQLKTSEVEVINWQNQLMTDKINFAKLLVLEPNKEFEIMPPKWSIDTILSYKANFDSLFIIAKDNRPDIGQYKAEERAALNEIKISRSTFMPKLGAFYSYGSFYSEDYKRINSEDNSSSNISFKDQLLIENFSQVYGFKLSIPIFNNLNNYTNVIRSKINYENTKLRYQDFEQQLYLDIKREYHNLLSYKESFAAKSLRAEAALKAYEKQYELYHMGKGNIVRLNLEYQRKTNSESEKIQAEYTLFFQKIILDYYLGTLYRN